MKGEWDYAFQAVACGVGRARLSRRLVRPFGVGDVHCRSEFEFCPFPTGAQADTFSVDGISDQSLPMWDAGFVGSDFAGLFEHSWVADSHIRYARYVVQWNVMSSDYTAERSIFEHWLEDVASLGLAADVSLTATTSLPAIRGGIRGGSHGNR